MLQNRTKFLPNSTVTSVFDIFFGNYIEKLTRTQRHCVPDCACCALAFYGYLLGFFRVNIFVNGISEPKVKPDGPGTQHRFLIAFRDD